MHDAIILSDIHLGSSVCQAKRLCQFLHNIKKRTTKLILNGDVFENMDFRRLTKHHWKVLSQLRKCSDDIEVIWLVGNHDGPAEIISHLLGIKVENEYVLKTGDKTLLCLHGDKFDKFLDDHPIVTWCGDLIYSLLQKIDESNYFAGLAKRSSKIYLNCAEAIRDKAIKYAYKLGYDMVCCGHSHHAVAAPPYFNCGCWTEYPGTYLTAEKGIIELRQYLETDDNT